MRTFRNVRDVAVGCNMETVSSGESSTRLRGSAGRALKTPTFFENFATGFARGNPYLDPESSTLMGAWDRSAPSLEGTGEIQTDLVRSVF